MVNADSLASAYQRCFSDSRPTLIAAAPGRVNLLGDHVDYNNGLVLPCAMDRATYVVAGPAADRRIRAQSSIDNKTVAFSIDEIDINSISDGSVYLMGVAAELQRAGKRLTGCDLYIDSDVPVGRGLSSSAALEVAVARALLGLTGENMDDAELAHMCHRAERIYAGVPCGIMDPFAAIMSRENSALLLDCRTESFDHIPWPNPEMTLVVIDSAFPRKLTDGRYAERRRQCEEALAQFRKADPRIESLRDVSPETLDRHRADLGPILQRRTRHVITEIERTSLAADALRSCDFSVLGRIMGESHESLRGDFDASTEPLDDLVRIACEVPGVKGARMTGGGFGGCIVAVCSQDAVADVEIAVKSRYDGAHSVRGQIIPVRLGKGAWTKQLQS